MQISRSKKIVFIGSECKLLSLLAKENETEVVSSISFLNTITMRFMPDLIVVSGLYMDVVKEVRRTEKLSLVPILIVAQNFSELNNFNDVKDFPRIMIVNECVGIDEKFIAHLGQILSGKKKLLPSRTSLIVKYAVLYINKNYGKKLTRRMIAEQLGVNEDYLTRIFRTEMGVGMWTYVTVLRLNFAKEILSRTDIPVNEIAFSCGFSDAAYFTKTFHEQFGVNPSSVRNF